MSLFSTFDFSALDDPEFKEDAVREELVAPLLKALGYSVSGAHKIVRSRRLTHPFVYFGTTKKRLTVVPDYTLIVDKKHHWVLDAKAPNEVLTSGKNPEQTYSYAMHPEIRASRYALCNGRDLVVYEANKLEPALIVNLRQIDDHWDDVKKLLSPLAFTKPELLNYKPDFGLYLLKSGATPEQTLHFVPFGLNMIGKMSDKMYSTTSTIGINGGLAATFEFDKIRLRQLIKALPPDKAAKATEELSIAPFIATFDEMVEVHVEARLSKNIESTGNEEFCPLNVERFSAL